MVDLELLLKTSLLLAKTSKKVFYSRLLIADYTSLFDLLSVDLIGLVLERGYTPLDIFRSIIDNSATELMNDINYSKQHLNEKFSKELL